MNRLFHLLALVAVIGLAACVGSRANPYKRSAVFDPAEYEPYAAQGTAKISGQAFMKTRGGDVKFAAGNIVNLNPVTTYSKEWFEQSVLGQNFMTDPDPRAAKYHREVRADGEGRFEFESLPEGDYYLACVITWEVAGQGGLSPTGGCAFATVHVGAGQHLKNVIVTR